jgi:hypothetical protein
MYNIRCNYIGCPPPEMELQEVMHRYSDNILPGCGGSIDVIQVKWRQCPTGDINRCKGKEGYPSVGFEVVSGFDCQILGVSSVNFGTRDDQQIVCTDETVTLIINEWYHNVCCNYFDESGDKQSDYRVFICDGGYMRWSELICPYKHELVNSVKGYFTANINSIWCRRLKFAHSERRSTRCFGPTRLTQE